MDVNAFAPREEAATDNRLDSNSSENGFDPPSDRSTWTADQIALLISLREQNVSRREIAARINYATGSNFTKSAVCGKIDRIFPVSKPIKTVEEKAATRQARRQRDILKKRLRRLKAKRSRSSAQCGTDRKAANGISRGLRPIPFIVSACDVEPLNISLLDLTPKQCRFPYGESAITFCGHQVIEGHSWCSGHARIVYQPRRAA